MISNPITSPGANSNSSTLFSGVSLLMITSLPSIICFLILCDNTPSNGLTPYSSQTFAITSVTSALVPAALIFLCAAYIAVYAATIASAFFPDTLPVPTTIVCAATTAYPSIWHPKSILAKSESYSIIESSYIGE